MTSTKERADKPSTDSDASDKPIKLNDLIPSRSVSGGRRTVFGSVRAKQADSKDKGSSK